MKFTRKYSVIDWVNRNLIQYNMRKSKAGVAAAFVWGLIGLVAAAIVLNTSLAFIGYLATTFALSAATLRTMRGLAYVATFVFYNVLVIAGLGDYEQKYSQIVKDQAAAAKQATIKRLQDAAENPNITWQQRVQDVNEVLTLMRKGIYAGNASAARCENLGFFEDENLRAQRLGIPQAVIEQFKTQNSRLCCVFTGKLALDPWRLKFTNVKTSKVSYVTVESSALLAYLDFTNTHVDQLSNLTCNIVHIVSTMETAEKFKKQVQEFFATQAAIFKPVPAARQEAATIAAKSKQDAALQSLYAIAKAAYQWMVTGSNAVVASKQEQAPRMQQSL